MAYLADVTDADAVQKACPGLRYIKSRDETRCELCVPLVWGPHRLGTLNFEHVQVRGLEPHLDYANLLAGQVAEALFETGKHARQLRSKDLIVLDRLVDATLATHHAAARSYGKLRDLARDQIECPSEDGLRRIVQEAEEGLATTRGVLQTLPNVAGPTVRIQLASWLGDLIERYTAEAGEATTLRFAQPVGVEVFLDTRPALVEWVLRSILDNSRSYASQKGGVEIDIQLKITDMGAELWLADDGPGLPAADLTKLYDWEQKTIVTHGSGRGLPLARLFIQSLGGEVVSSLRETGGLQTRITLPSSLIRSRLHDGTLDDAI
jgi:signal transduction histidine kinase